MIFRGGAAYMFGRRGFTSLLLGAFTLTALSACGPSREDTAELRYRLTVEVDTPQGLRSGSSVIAVKAVRNPDWVNPEGRGNRASFIGEAAAVDLPGGRTLFALLNIENGYDAALYPLLAFESEGSTRKDDLQNEKDLVAKYQSLSNTSSRAAMPRRVETGCVPSQNCDDNSYPMLVTFGDIKDPTSVKRVDPDDLSASFGAGVKLKAITVEIRRGPLDLIADFIINRHAFLGRGVELFFGVQDAGGFGFGNRLRLSARAQKSGDLGGVFAQVIDIIVHVQFGEHVTGEKLAFRFDLFAAANLGNFFGGNLDSFDQL